MPRLLDQIERKILEILKANSFDVDSINFQQIETGQILQLSRPVALIDSRNGFFSRETTKQTNIVSTITVTLVIHNLRSSAARELQISVLRDTLIGTLHHNKLGLDLKNGLLFQSYSNVTSRGGASDQQKLGFHIDEINFTVEYPILELKQPEDVESGDLKKIVTDFFINDDSIIDLESEVDLNIADGGTAYKSSNTVIDGGSSKEDQSKEILNGGKS